MDCRIGVTAALALALGVPVAALAAQPVTGIYNQYQYVKSVSSNPAGLTDCHTVGDTLGGYFDYPGPDKTGAKSTGAIEGTTTMYTDICRLPTTPAAGASSWSGTENCTDTDIGGAASQHTNTFSWASITYVDTNDWLFEKTVTYAVSGGTCTEVRDTALQRTGK